ncbi:MAG: tsf [Acidimicrobiales bacterium]|nr:tsf [Acidimicrobiales bacterium]
MPDFTAKDVQALRQATGAGMMDAKRALQENDGNMDEAKKWLREKGLAKASDRSDRDNSQGAIAVSTIGGVAAIAQLKSETDFVAKSEQFTNLVQEIAALVAANGPEAAQQKADAIDDLKVVLKENIELGDVVRIEAPEGHVVDTYLHYQDGRGVNGVIVQLEGGTPDLAHEVAVHVAFTKPTFLSRSDVPDADIAEERETLTNITRAEGKPAAAVDKIVEGRLGGWFRDRVLLEQSYVKDEKVTIEQLLGDAKIIRFAQVAIGA